MSKYEINKLKDWSSEALHTHTCALIGLVSTPAFAWGRKIDGHILSTRCNWFPIMLLSILRISHCVIWPRLVVIRELFVSANSNGSISSRHVHTGAQHLRGQTVFIVFQIKRSCGKCYCATRERRNLFLVQQQLNKNKQIESSFEFWDQYFGYKIQISRFAMHHRTTCMWKWLLEVINPQGMIFWLGSPPQLEAFKSPPVSFQPTTFCFARLTLLITSYSGHSGQLLTSRRKLDLRNHLWVSLQQASNCDRLSPNHSYSDQSVSEQLRNYCGMSYVCGSSDCSKTTTGGCERGLA